MLGVDDAGDPRLHRTLWLFGVSVPLVEPPERGNHPIARHQWVTAGLEGDCPHRWPKATNAADRHKRTAKH